MLLFMGFHSFFLVSLIRPFSSSAFSLLPGATIVAPGKFMDSTPQSYLGFCVAGKVCLQDLY